MCLIIGFADQNFNIRNQMKSSDIFAYKVASDVLSDGKDPYNPKIIAEAQSARAGETVHVPAMVWNPPIFFLFPGFLLHLPDTILFAIWPLFLTCAACLLAVIGWTQSRSRDLNIFLLASSLVCVPFFYDFATSQMTVLLALPVLLGAVIFIASRHDLLAGALLVAAVIKPHVFFLPVTTIAYWTFTQRRWRVVVGGATGLTVGIIATAMIYPGIWRLWLERSSWPINVTGSAWATQFRWLSSHFGLEDPFFIAPIFPIAGLLGLLFYLHRYSPIPNFETLGISIVFNQIFTPYGFIFDLSLLIAVQAYLLAELREQTALRVGVPLILLANCSYIFASALLPEKLTLLSGPIFHVAVIIVYGNLIHKVRQSRRAGPIEITSSC